jgi:hypothetical protein
MKENSTLTNEDKDETRVMVETYYKKIMRILEYYVLACFIMD